jgi:hypothetical protein
VKRACNECRQQKVGNQSLHCKGAAHTRTAVVSCSAAVRKVRSIRIGGGQLQKSVSVEHGTSTSE